MNLLETFLKVSCPVGKGVRHLPPLRSPVVLACVCASLGICALGCSLAGRVDVVIRSMRQPLLCEGPSHAEGPLIQGALFREPKPCEIRRGTMTGVDENFDPRAVQ